MIPILIIHLNLYRNQHTFPKPIMITVFYDNYVYLIAMVYLCIFHLILTTSAYVDT